jgi:hypothetical protein
VDDFWLERPFEGTCGVADASVTADEDEAGSDSWLSASADRRVVLVSLRDDGCLLVEVAGRDLTFGGIVT